MPQNEPQTMGIGDVNEALEAIAGSELEGKDKIVSVINSLVGSHLELQQQLAGTKEVRDELRMALDGCKGQLNIEKSKNAQAENTLKEARMAVQRGNKLNGDLTRRVQELEAQVDAANAEAEIATTDGVSVN